MKRIFLLITILTFLSSAVFATSPEKRPTPAEKEAATGGVVYYGMTRKDLEGLYVHFSDKDYWRDDDMEWITFSGCSTEAPTDAITFRLEDGKVKDWYNGRRGP